MRSIGEIHFDQIRNEARDFIDDELRQVLAIEMAAALEAETPEERKARYVADAKAQADIRKILPSLFPVINWSPKSRCDKGALIVPKWKGATEIYVAMDIGRSGSSLSATHAWLDGLVQSAPIDDWRLATPEEIAAVMPALKHAAE